MGHHRVSRCYRHPRTTAEKRQCGIKRSYLYFDEYKVCIRPSRNMVNLPCSREDIHRSDWRDRSWKTNRKTQWKPKPLGDDFFDGKTLGQMLVEAFEELVKDLKSGIDLSTKYRTTNCPIPDERDASN